MKTNDPSLRPRVLAGCLTLFLCLTPVPGKAQAPPEDALEQVLDSLESLGAEPQDVGSILKWIEEQESQTRKELEKVDQDLAQLNRRLKALKTGESLALTAAAPSAPSQAPRSGKVDFTREIRPILASKCLKCHGQDEKTRKAHLRLDTFEGATEKAIQAGNSAASELVSRICAPSDADRMPPPETGLTLSPEEIETLTRWIDQGAVYQAHWAFVKPVQAALPEVSRPEWARNPIDRFVLHRLDQEGLSPAPEADKATLARRVFLDLIGLPPTVEELETFLEDSSPDAYEKLVDRLLASPHYGERWARMWLDLARYADTKGYEKDDRRDIWRYRDWVIDAFNRDMPFDQFTIEQLAGDLLPDADHGAAHRHRLPPQHHDQRRGRHR